MLIDQMNNPYECGSKQGNGEFKAPAPILNKLQSSLINKNKDTTLKFFSKLPCIKTCMSKISFGSNKI